MHPPLTLPTASRYATGTRPAALLVKCFWTSTWQLPEGVRGTEVGGRGTELPVTVVPQSRPRSERAPVGTRATEVGG